MSTLAQQAPTLRRSVSDLLYTRRGLLLLALLPGTAAMTVFFGPGVLWQIALAVALALALEALMLRLRGQPLRPFLTDLSAPLTAVLFALCLPPLAPWWLAAIGMFAAIVVAKHLFGGLGHNLFNPAMVGLAVVLLASFMGTVTPLLLNRVGINPAVASGPFITTANDLIGIGVYFLIADFLLSEL